MLRPTEPPPGRKFPEPPVRSAIAIRDAVFSFFSPLVPHAFLTARKVGMPTLNPDELPNISIYTLAEDAPALGLPNMGIIKYRNDMTLAISVTRGFSDPVYLQGGLESDVQFIKNTLLTDADFTRRWYGALFESIPSFRTRYVFTDGGEAYFAELRLEMVFRFSEVYTPVITDEFRELDVKVKHGHDSGINLEARYFLYMKERGHENFGSA
jgi:hypothetical protein